MTGGEGNVTDEKRRGRTEKEDEKGIPQWLGWVKSKQNHSKKSKRERERKERRAGANG